MQCPVNQFFVCTTCSIFIATCSFGVRHCHGYCCFCALVEGLSRAFLRQQEAERHDMRGLIETLPRGNDRLCFFTGWRRNVLLPISLYRVDQDCLTFHCFIQVGAGMSYFPLLYTGWTWNALLPIILHRVDLKCLTSHCLTQGWPGMSYFPSLYTGLARNVLLPISLHRVDLECLTSHRFTQGGSGMSYFLYDIENVKT